ncbi:MAG: nucleotidyltransferase domain-containing protein [Bryobacteraceae bacterium]
MRAAQLGTILQEFRHGLEQIYGSRLAGLLLFGSQARGDALPDSDIDVMVMLHGQVNPLREASRISRFRGDLCLRHNVVITCVYISAEEARAADNPLLQNIRAEGVAL